MPLPYRRRLGLALGGAVAVAAIALLPAAPATAATPSVTFNGSCGVLGVLAPASVPNPSSVSVPAGSAVTFVNGLSQVADLRLDNQSSSSVPAGGSITKVFEHGPVAVSMVPGCLLNLLAAVKAVTVTVTSAPVPGPTQQQGGSGGQPNPPATAGGGQGQPQQGRPPGQGTLPAAGAQPVLPTFAPGGAPAASPEADGSEPPVIAGAVEPGPAGTRGASGLLIAMAVASIVVACIVAIRAILAKRAARAVGA